MLAERGWEGDARGFRCPICQVRMMTFTFSSSVLTSVKNASARFAGAVAYVSTRRDGTNVLSAKVCAERKMISGKNAALMRLAGFPT